MKRLVLVAMLATAFPAGAAVLGTEPFTIDTTAQGGTKVADIGAVDYSFQLGLDTVADKFNISGIGFASSFRKSLGDPPIPGTGLGTAYNVYAQVIAGGHSLTTGDPDLFIGQYDNFHADVRIDPLKDSHADGTGQSDDITIYSGNLAKGASINSINTQTGLFKVLLDTTFTLPGKFNFEYQSQPQVILTGVFAGDALSNVGATQFDVPIEGSGNFTAAVPEPGTYAMLIAGLLGIVGVSRRRFK